MSRIVKTMAIVITMVMCLLTFAHLGQADEQLIARLKADIDFLCSPELNGRAIPGSTGDETARWLQRQFINFDFQPAIGDTTYFQEVELQTAYLDTAKTTLSISGSEQLSYTWGDEFYIFPKHIAVIEGSFPLVLEIDTSHIPGSAVVVVAGEEPAAAMRASYAVVRKANSLARQGASLVLWVTDPNSDSWPPLRVQNKLSTVTDLLVDAPGASLGVPTVYLRGNGRFLPNIALLESGASDESLNVKLDFAFREKSENRAFNVVGIVDGVKPEYIILGAHYDHLGETTEDGESVYYPGADDNASGVAGLLEICRMWAVDTKPQRGLIAVAFTAEEDGLLGSRAFVENLPVDRDAISAMINLDMIGRDAFSNMRDVHNPSAAPTPGYAAVFYSVGSPTLHDIAKGASSMVDLDVEIRPVNSFSYFGDAGPFNEAGIPTIHVFSGFHADYHSLTDTVNKLNFDKLQKMISLINGLLINLANQPENPGFDPNLRVEESNPHH